MTILLDDMPGEATTTHGLATPDQLALLAWHDANKVGGAHPEAEGGRYTLPHPETGADTRWTRVTTFCEAIDDGTGLTLWKLGLTVRGLVHNDALMAQARAEHDNDKACRAIAEQAHLWAGSKLAAAIGTALHTATEHHDLATGIRPPDPWGAHVDAWADALDRHGLAIVPGWIERVVVNVPLGVAGTLDRLVTLPDGRVVVLDVKTGKDPKKVGYAVQAAAYASATHAWTPDGYEPLPDVDQTVALVAHLSADTGECEVWTVDLTAGHAKAQAVAAIRAARSIRGVFTRLDEVKRPALGDHLDMRMAATDEPVKVGDLLPELEASIRARGLDPASPTCGTDHTARVVEVRERIKALQGDPDATRLLVTGWPADTPHKPPWTAEQLAAVEVLVHQADGRETTFLGDPDPALVAKVDAAREAFATITETVFSRAPLDGPDMEPADGAALKAAAKALPDAQRHHLAGWQAEAKRGGRPWGRIDPQPTQRTHAIILAALRCVTALWDDDEPDTLTRCALHLATGDELQPTWSTGAVMGALTIDEANRLDELAAGFAASDPTTCAAIGALVTTYTKEQ